MPVPLGQTVRVRGADVDGEVCPLSYARVASGPQFAVFARERQPPGRRESPGPRLFDPLTATDDRGTSYQVTIRDIGSPVLGWTLMLLPDPPHDRICDSSGRWHVTRTSGQSGMDGEIALRLEIVPPLSHTTTWIKVRATGKTAQARQAPASLAITLAPAARNPLIRRAAPPQPGNGAR